MAKSHVTVSVTWLITLGRGRYRPWVLGVQKDWFEPALNILVHTSLSPTLTSFYFYFPPFKSVVKNKILRYKNIGGGGRHLPLSPQVTSVHVTRDISQRQGRP
jgi:hypothetical protein